METGRKSCEFIKKHETQCVILLLAVMPTLILIVLALLSQMVIDKASLNLVTEFANNLYQEQILAQKIENYAIVFQLNDQVQRVAWQMRLLTAFLSKVVEGDATINTGYVASKLNIDRAYTDDEDPTILSLFHRSQFLVSSWHQINASYVSDLNSIQKQELLMSERLDPLWRSIKYDNDKTDWKKLMIRDIYLTHEYDGLIYMTSINTTYQNYSIPKGCQYLGKWKLDLRCRYYYEPTMKTPGLQLFDPQIFYTAATPYLASVYCTRYLKKNGISLPSSDPSSYSRYGLICTSIDLRAVSSYFSSLSSYSKYRMVIDPLQQTVIYNSETELSYNKITSIYESETKYLQDQASAKLFVQKLRNNSRYLIANFTDLRTQHVSIDSLQTTFEYDRNGTSCFAIINRVTMIDKPIQREIDTKVASKYQLKLAFLFLDVLTKKKMTEYAENVMNEVDNWTQIFFHVTWSINAIILLIDIYYAYLLAARILLPVANLTKILQSIQFSDQLGVIEQQNQQFNRQNSKNAQGFPNERHLKKMKSMSSINRATSIIKQERAPLDSKFRESSESSPEFVSSPKIPKKKKSHPARILDQNVNIGQIIHISADQPKTLSSPLNSNRIMRLTKTLKENPPNSCSNSNQLLQESSDLEEDYPMEDYFESINTESVIGDKGILINNQLQEGEEDDMFLSSDMKVLFESFQSMFRVLSFTTQNLFKENESVSLLNLNNQIQHFEKFGNHRALGVCNNNIGYLHYNAKRYKEALQYFDAAAIHAKYELGFYSDNLDETTQAIQSCLKQTSEFTYKDLFEFQQLSAMSISEKKLNDERYSRQNSLQKQSFNLNNNYQQNSNNNLGSEVLPLTPSIEPRANHKISCEELINNQIDNSPIRDYQIKSNINSQNLLNENHSENVEQYCYLESPKLQFNSHQDMAENKEYENTGREIPSNFSKPRDKDKSGILNQTIQNLSIQTSLSAEREELCWSLYNRRMNYAKALYSLLSESKEASQISMWSSFESVAIETTAISQVLLPQSNKREMVNYQLITVAQTLELKPLEARETLSRFSALYIKNLQEKGKNEKNFLKILQSRNKQISFFRQQSNTNELNQHEMSQRLVQGQKLDVPVQSQNPSSNVSIANDITQIYHKSSYSQNNNANRKKQQIQDICDEEQLDDSKQSEIKSLNKKDDQIQEELTHIIEEVNQNDDNYSNSFQEHHFMGEDGQKINIPSKNNDFLTSNSQLSRYPNGSPRNNEFNSSYRLRAFSKTPIFSGKRTKSVHRLSPLQGPSKYPLNRFFSATSEVYQTQKNHEEGDNESTSPSHKAVLATGFYQQHTHVTKEPIAYKRKITIQESNNSSVQSSEISTPSLLLQTALWQQQKNPVNLSNNPQLSQTLVKWTKLPMLKDQDTKDNTSMEGILNTHHNLIMNERINRTQKNTISKPGKSKKLEQIKSSSEDLRNSISLMSKISAQHKTEKKQAEQKQQKSDIKRFQARYHRNLQHKSTLFKPFKRCYFGIRKIDKGEAISKSEFSSDIMFTHYIILQSLFWLQRGNTIAAANLLTAPLEQCEYYLPHMRSFLLCSIHDILKSHALFDPSLDEMVRNSKMSQHRMFRIVVASTGLSQFSQQRTYFLCNDLISEILFRPTDWFGLLLYDHSEKLFQMVMAFTKKSIISQAPVRFDSIIKDALIFSLPYADNVLSSSSSLNETKEVSSGRIKPIECLVLQKSPQQEFRRNSGQSSSLSSSSSLSHASSGQSISESFNFMDENVPSTARDRIIQKYHKKKNEDEEGESPNKSAVESEEHSKLSEQPRLQHLSLGGEPEKSENTCISSLSKYQCITETIFNRKTKQALLKQSSASYISSNSQVKPPQSPLLSLLHSTNQWNTNKSQDIISDQILDQPSFSRNNSAIPLQPIEETQTNLVKQQIPHSSNGQSVEIIQDGQFNSTKEQNQSQIPEKYPFSLEKHSSSSSSSPLENGQKRKQLQVNTQHQNQEQTNRSKYFQQSFSLIHDNALDPHAVRQHSFTFSKPVQHIPFSHISNDQFSPSKSPPKSASIPRFNVFSQSPDSPSKIPPKSACLARTNKVLYPKNSTKNLNNHKNQLPSTRQRSSEEIFHLAIQASLKNFLLDSSQKISCYVSEKRYRRSEQTAKTQDRRHQMEIKTFLIFSTDDELKFENKQLFNDLCELLKDLRVELLVLFLNSKQQLEEYSLLEDVMLGTMSVMKFFASEQKLLQYVYNQREHVSNQTKPLVVEHF